MHGFGLGFLQIFQDDGGFENGRVADLQHRCLAQRRKGVEPAGLMGEIDVKALAGHALFAKRNDGALNVGAEMVADQDEGLGHGGAILARFAQARAAAGRPRPAKPDDGLSAKAPSPSKACARLAMIRYAGYSQPPPAALNTQPLPPCTQTMAPSSGGSSASATQRA